MLQYLKLNRFLLLFFAVTIMGGTTFFVNCNCGESPKEECTSGEKQCEGNVAMVCGTDKRWEKTNCASDQKCEKGECKADTSKTNGCTSGEKKCEGNEAMICTADQKWQKTSCTSDQRCENGECKARETTAICSGTQIAKTQTIQIFAKTWTRDNKLLTLRRIITGVFATQQEKRSGEITSTTTIEQEDEMVLEVKIRHRPGATQVTVNYGTGFEGIKYALLTADDKHVSGEIDGRKLISFPTTTKPDALKLEFEDGKEASKITVSTHLTDALKQLFQKAAEVQGQSCPIDGATEISFPQEPNHGVSGNQVNPFTDSDCGKCWALCGKDAAICIGGAGAGCAALWAVPFVGGVLFAGCVAVAVAVCGGIQIACFISCREPGKPCCPVTCGQSSSYDDFSYCCKKDETCLDPKRGVCCDGGRTPCANRTCCVPNDVCIANGSQIGTCCSKSNLCGTNTCCGDKFKCVDDKKELCCPEDVVGCDGKCCEKKGDACIKEKCCPKDQSCGSNCCDALSTCIDPQKGTCCGFAEVACNGTCCKIGSVCLNGSCCPEARSCKTTCCGVGQYCNTQTDKCTQCPPLWVACPGYCCPLSTPMCNGFDEQGKAICCKKDEKYCEGQCRPISECIK